MDDAASCASAEDNEASGGLNVALTSCVDLGPSNYRVRQLQPLIQTDDHHLGRDDSNSCEDFR